MAAPIPLWADYDGMMHRRLAKASSDTIRTRRLLALAEIYEGGARSNAARIAASLLWTRSSAMMPPTCALLAKYYAQVGSQSIDAECPFWVKRRSPAVALGCPLLGVKRT